MMSAETNAAATGAGEPDVREQFTEWLAREMPPGTVVSNPRWWAPKIIRAFHDYRTVARERAKTAENGFADALPELPDSYGDHCVTDSVRTMREPGYTADQMRAYAKAALAAQPAAPGAGESSRFFIDHGMVHDRKSGKHLVGFDYAGEQPDTLLAVLRELENDAWAWRQTARAVDVSVTTAAAPGAGEGRVRRPDPEIDMLTEEESRRLSAGLPIWPVSD